MNKKAMAMLEVITAVVLSVIMIFLLYKYAFSSFKIVDKEETDVYGFYTKQLANTINEILVNSEKSTNYLSNKDYVLIGFNNQEIIAEESLKDECGKLDIVYPLTKPKQCLGKSCLCLCKIKGIIETTYPGYGDLGDKNVVCDEKSACEVVNTNIARNDRCNYLLYYQENDNLRNVKIQKKQDKAVLNFN